MKILFLSIFYLLNISAIAEEPCNHQDITSDFKGKLSPEERAKLKAICQNVEPIKNQAELEDILSFFLDQANLHNHSNRHLAARRLNRCEPTSDSKVLIIAFEGTGAYEPLMPATIQMFNQCFSGNISPGFNANINYTLTQIFKKKFHRDPKWSTLQAGIQSDLVKIENARFVDWYSFPSEESETLAGTKEALRTNLHQLYNDIKNSIAVNPKGIQNARNCIKKYTDASRKIGIKPKVIILSHSSGSRSLVKFAEHIKKDSGTNIDLAFTIDPVKEAHEAIKEVLPQKAGEPARFLKWKITGGDYPYSAVWSRSQPKSLYKASNVKKHINFYQTEDREGLKIGGDLARFGIHGSPIQGGENIHLKSIGADAHGSIGYQSPVLERFQRELELLLKD